jgi:predicted TIM-barrel fold metal-dependent hydrolase
MPTIDGDAHVMEGPHTWEYCDPSERKFMPVLLNPGPQADRQFWLIDGKIRGHVRHVVKPKDFQALAEASGRDMVVSPEAQHLEDVQARIRHMDETGVDMQVMYPTIFVQQIADKPEFEVPICKSYNRWLADVWKQGQGAGYAGSVPCRSSACPTHWTCCLGAKNMVRLLFSCVRLKEIGSFRIRTSTRCTKR